MKIYLSVFLSLILLTGWSQPRNSTIKEYKKSFRTYPFSDPDPIAKMSAFYPYFRFDGYTDKSTDKEWKVVTLENEFIEVMILPEIGGKIWAAIEKSTGKPFIYYNHVVKFRDIAMRGPWTSGGIEANYGIIGHTPNCSTPVDYLTRTNEDGSVSCFIGTLDLLTQTYWTIEINLPKDKAYFTTRSFWSNTTPFEQPYYTWMNAGIQAEGNLEFIYPGTHYLTHDGDSKPWKMNLETGEDISFYDRNDFGPYKSYHVFGKYTNFFGGFWHKDNFGMGRYAAHDEKAGKKIWIWGLSQQGMIWEKLLTDKDGQYVEVQSGRLFNQTAEASTRTPFKHRGFAPYTTDTWTEYWFPVKGTQGFVTANPVGAMNVRVNARGVRVDISPLTDNQQLLTITRGRKNIYSKKVELKTLKVFSDSIGVSTSGEPISVMLGDHLLEYNTDPQDGVLSRPVESPRDFDWGSVQGLYLQGKEHIRERSYVKAGESLDECLIKDPHYLPALTERATLHYRNMEYAKALELLMHALRIDTYDPAVNFYYGLTNVALGKITDARDGFDIAAMSSVYRGAAYTELSRMELRNKRPDRAIHYAARSLESNTNNVEALQLMTVAYQLKNDRVKVKETLDVLSGLNPLNHFVALEQYLSASTTEARTNFTTGIRHELAVESYLELAAWYYNLGSIRESQAILSVAPVNAEVLYWLAFLEEKLIGVAGTSLTRALQAPVEMVFPFRSESAEVLGWARGKSENWKPTYLLALIYWNMNQPQKARELFAACGSSPDFAPFYAVRADLILESRLQDLQKAAALDPMEWRYGKLLVQHHLSTKNYVQALQLALAYDKKIPGDFRIRMMLAKTQLLNKNYKACTDILAKTNVLPYEGSTEGRMLYQEAWILQAVDKMKERKYAEALSMISNARIWPENLGVGKPYDADIDSRVEYFLEGLCQEGMKNVDKAKKSWDAVLAQQASNRGANDLVTAWAFKKTGQLEKGELLLKAWRSADEKNFLATWCLDVYRNMDAQTSVDMEDKGGRVVQAIFSLRP